MRDFLNRHRLPLKVWMYLALASLIVCTLLWLNVVPSERPAMMPYFLKVLLLMLSWGALIGVWIAQHEIGRHYQRKLAKAEQRIHEAHTSTEA